jgi:hypothetical protein
LQQLAADRIHEAAILLDAGCWSGAFYLAGYAVECALKSCIITYINQTGVLFKNKKWAQDCWTHDLAQLLQQAGLDAEWKIAAAVNPTLSGNWMVVKDWNEQARYEQKTESQARRLYDAITDSKDGVLKWIQMHW